MSPSRFPLRRRTAAAFPHPRPWCAALGLLAAICWTPGAHAQSAADLANGARNAERIQREQDERQRAQLQQELERARPRSELAAPAAAPVAASAATGCVAVRQIGIAGAPHLPAAARARIVQKYAGRCLTLADIQLLLADLVGDYIGRGQIAARAYVGQQDASQGSLEILVVEGQLEDIRIDDGGKHSIQIDTAFPGLLGQVLNLRDLEQGLDQINRLASNQATLQLLPGSTAGDSVVAISNEPGRRWRINLSADNEGSESTGRKQAGAGISVDNLLNLNDFLSLNYRRAVPTDYERQGSTSKNLAYVLPYGYNTYTLGASQSLYVSTLRTAGGLDLKSNGDSTSGFVQADRVVYRDQSSRANLSTTLTVKSSNNFLAEQLLAASSRKLAVWDLDASGSSHLWGAIVSGQLGYTRGLDRFGALRDADGLPGNAPKAQFRKLRYGASYLLPFAVGSTELSFSSSLSGQRGIDVLYGSEQMLVGGMYSVRGYVNTTLSGDTGFFVRNDLSARLPFALPGGRPAQLRPYLGFDYGRVAARGADTQSGYLAGAAAGLSLGVGSVFVDLFDAVPVGMSSGQKRESGRLYLQLRAAL